MSWRSTTIKAKEIFHKYLWDLVLVGVVTLAAGGTLIYYSVHQSHQGDVSATIYKSGSFLESLDLAKETEERSFTITGTKGDLLIGVKHNAIAILESGCPGQYCVQQGYVSEAGHPIVCAYNEIYISLSGSALNDVEVL
jgi:hypothetical protein